MFPDLRLYDTWLKFVCQFKLNKTSILKKDIGPICKLQIKVDTKNLTLRKKCYKSWPQNMMAKQ